MAEKTGKAKSKKPKVKKSLLPGGIRRRWMTHGMLVVVVATIIFVFAFSLLIANYYTSTVRTGLETKAKTATDFFTNYISRTYAEYYDSAYGYIETFEDAGKIELQFIDTTGSVVVSSYSITSGTSPGTPEIRNAIDTATISSWTGENPTTGERIMAVSAPMLYSNGQVIGVMRYVTSMELVDQQILISILVAVALGLVVVLLVMVTSMFFIRSVIAPVNEITRTAQRIAQGSYGVQIDKEYQDEMGTMVQAINEMSLKIGQSEKTQTEFISSVSHELRTPLTAITGWGETLIFDESLDDDARRGIGIILKEARRLTKMVEELLEFTRMQDGRFTLNIEKIDVGAELEDSIFTYQELLRQDEVVLEYEPYEGDLPIINGDPERLRQVFLNILDNAAKYGREGKRIVVTIDTDSSYVAIKIRDFGPGVPEDELENVKKKFYKGASKERGSGIGLAVCDEIVKYHNGLLQLENAEDGGLVVTVRLPIRGEE